MKKMPILLICLLFLLVLSGIAGAGDTFIVHQSGTSPCTTASPDDSSHYKNTIQDAVDNLTPGNGDTAIVCPGTYTENVVWRLKGYASLKSYSQNPSDTIVEAAVSDKPVFLLWSGQDKSISGFTITGATADDTACKYERSKVGGGMETIIDNPPQPCAGIRMYGIVTGSIKNNLITGNHTGIIVKDTAYDWGFYVFIENNVIRDNIEVGLHFRYGNDSYVWNNHIYNNQIGISLVDTWRQSIVGNTVEDNDTGIEIKSHLYPRGEATAGAIIYQNNFIDNNNNITPQVYDDAPGETKYGDSSVECSLLEDYWDPLQPDQPNPDCNSQCKLHHFFCDVCPDTDADDKPDCQHYWHSPTLSIGNFWTDYYGFDNGSNGRTNGDGIGDTEIPHPPDPDCETANFPDIEKCYDYYPLIASFGYPYPFSINDMDFDSVENQIDNCPNVPNVSQDDSDDNGRGDACECADDDNVRNMVVDLEDVESYSSLQDAYDDNNNPDNSNLHPYHRNRLQLRSGIINGGLNMTPLINISEKMSPPTRFNLYNGFNCDYTTNNGITRLKGTVVVVDNPDPAPDITATVYVSSGTLSIKNGTLVVSK
jgi:parallel beta-helix repeat protein